MTESRNRRFAKLAKDVDASGDITADAIASTVSFGVDVYDSIGLLPYVGNSDGDQAFVASNNRLYIWNGSGWYNVALINRAPAISSVLDSDGNTTPFILSTTGAVTTITITAADSDGDPVTYSAIADSNFAGLGTLSQESNVFTITPFSQDSASTTSGTITFRATDGVNIASSGVQTFTLVFLSSYWNETVLSIGTNSTNGLANSTFIDRSTNAHTVTPSGSPVQTAFHPYLDNWGVAFNGTSDYLRADTALDALSLGTDIWTIEFWMWSDGNATDGSIIPIGINTANNGDNTFLYRLGSILVGSSVYNFSSALTQYKWVHVAITFDATNVKVYHDGVLVLTQAVAAMPYAFAVCVLGIGCEFDSANGGTPGNYFKGYISDFRISDNVRYTTAFTPPTEKLTSDGNTLFLGLQSNRFVDNSSTPKTITAYSAPSISAFNPFGQGSEYASGGNKGSGYLFENNLVVPHNSNFNLASNDFTISCWVYLTEYPGTYSGSGAGNNALILAKDTLNAREFTLGIDGTSTSYTNIRYTLFTSNASPVGLSASYNFQLNTWYHIAVVRNGASTRFYVNGADVGGGNSANPQSTSTELTIGAQGSYWRSQGYQYWFRGHIADLRLALNQVDYTTNFTPPTSPVENTNASLYLPMDNAGIYDKTGNITFIVPTEAAQGAPLTDTAITKYASSSLNCGTISEDKLYELAGTPALGTGPFTVETWIYPTNVTGTWQSIISRGYAGTGSFRLYKVSTTPGLTWYQASTALIASGSVPLVNETWYHVAVCRDTNSDMRMFIDGVQVGSTVNSTYDYLMTDELDPVNIGSGGRGEASAYPFAGNIEGTQILIGVAKYTANFTPPDQEQGLVYQAES